MNEIPINKLTAEEIQELNKYAAQKIILENVNLIADIEKQIFNLTGKVGMARIELDQVKSAKKTIIEQNRALKSVISSG